MKKQTVIITGANSGLGFECTQFIAEADKNWHIVMACRDIAKGNRAKKEIVDTTGNKDISVYALDLASFKSIHNFVERFVKSDLPPLRGLINNAGTQVMSGLRYTKDNYEITFGTNHLGHFLLTNLLLDQFESPGRIIVVSSGTHDPETMEGKYNKPVFLGAKELAKPRSEKEMSGIQRYSTSKLANVLFSYKLADLLKDKDTTVNAYDPAAVPATNLLSSVENPLLRWSIKMSTKLFSVLGVKVSTPQVSGEAMARLLLDEKLENVTGKYFQINREKQSSKQSYDKRLQKDLWQDSLELTGLKS